MAGVDGGGQDFEVAGFGVVVAFPVSFTFCNEAFPTAAELFSFSASRSFVVSTVGAPSMNWKALSFVRV
jgi:hypothetical protein